MAGDFLPPLILELRAKTGEFTSEMHKAKGEMKKTAAEAETMGQRVSGHMHTMGKVGKAALFGIVGGSIAVGAVAVKMAGDYQEATTQLVTGAGESESAIDGVRKGMLAMAGQVGQTPVQLAKGMYMIESAGYHGAQGLSVLKAAAQGATVGGADMMTVADGLTTAMNDYHIPASKAALVTSQLVATVGAGKTTMGDLSGALSHILPFTSALHVGFSDVMGAMATMTGQGVHAADAATYLKFTVMALANESPKGAAALKEVGLSSTEVANSLSKHGLHDTLIMITDAIGKKFPKGSAQYTAALANAVGGTRGMAAALALTGGNLKTYTANIKTIGSATTEAGGNVKGFGETQKDLNVQIRNVKAQVTAMAIQLGDWLIPKIEAATKVGVKMTQWLMAHKPVLEAVAITIGTVLVVAIGAYIASMAAAAVATIAATWPILAIIAAIAGVVAALVYAWHHWASFRDGVSAAVRILKDVVRSLVDVWKAVLREAGHFIEVWKGRIQAVFDFVRPAFADLGKVVAAFGRMWGDIWNAVGAVVSKVWGFIGPIIEKIAGAISKIAGPIAKVVGAVGGFVGGQVSSMKHMLGFAGGTNFAPGGLAVVGENGPEIMDVPRGARIYPHGTGPSMGGGGGPVHITNVVTLDGQVIYRNVVMHAQRYRARNGATNLT